ncbi:DNA polymerase III, alpha subunit [Actinobacteria bacterium IMCC26207]|nr:DNA polymerase III, alpha subunit [Actinobacteria bacterium IMCC26207]
MADSFVHLHQHTEYSMLDGAARIGDVVASAVKDGQPAMGITDHGNMYGVLDFYQECNKAGVKPIIGSELYMAHEHRDERLQLRGSRMDDSGGEVEGGKKAYYHLTTLVENQVGYKNLIQLSSRAFMEGYYRKPKVDWEILEEHSEGLIVTTGCLGGHVLQAMMNQGFDAACERAGRLLDIFGRDHLFVEIQDHGIPDQLRTNPQLIQLAKRLKLPLLATNDSHYVNQGDAVAHDALLCVQTGSQLSDPDRFRFHGDHHYLKTAEEMRYLFREVEVACDNSLWIAERCELEIEFGKPLLPNFPLPEGFADDAAYLEHLTFAGAHARWGSDLPDTVLERLAYELKVIGDMGFSSYFLITWDLIKHARDSNIRVGPGRGSAAGCAVAYCLRITDLDPIKYDLLFERFLNPSRVSMPDIDMDFDSRYRDEMIRYAAERYGRDRVAQIVTFSTIKARAAVRDAARVLGKPYSVGDKVAKAMPALVLGRDTPLYACLEEHPKYLDGYKMASDIRQMYHEDPDAREVIEVAKGLEGLRRGDGIHAAAVVITKEPLTDYLPIQRKPESGKNPEDAPVVTQYEMHGVEDLGLLKMDFLGLRNLDVISDTLTLIQQTRGIEVDIDNVDLEDEATYALLSRGDSIGVFQLESSPIRALMRSLAPTEFEDVAALVALYRPGPMAANMHYDYADRKNGRKPVEYLHPDAQEVLGDTYALMVYQESMMRIAQKFAGYSLAEADNLRKACGKKDKELIARERIKFIEGCVATGYGQELGTAWFDIIEPFADYAFNKSHAYGYGYIAYQTAYLKANYPAEYLAALLTSVRTSLDKAAIFLAECRAMGIEVVVPDVNGSTTDFTPVIGAAEDGTEELRILFGLSAVRNVGAGLVAHIVTEREDQGAFTDFYDFSQRVNTQVLNKKTIEALIKAGSFDSMGHSRQGLLMVYEQIIDQTVARRKEHEMGVMSLFAEPETASPAFDERVVIPTSDFDKKQRLVFEKEMLGMYVSDHPLLGAETALRKKTDCTLPELFEADVEDGARRTVGGVISGLQRKWTKKGDLMAVFTLEDLQGVVEVMVFPRTMTEIGHLLAEDAVVLIGGRVDKRDDTPKLIATDIEIFDAMPETDPPLRLHLSPTRLNDTTVKRLKELFLDFPGTSQVLLLLDETHVLQLPEQYMVSTQSGLVGELRALLGHEAVVV